MGFMSNTISAKSKSTADWRQLNQQVAQAKALMKRMRETIEDIEDARIIEQAKRANGNKPRIPWSQVKKEFGFDF
jgi:hypothetical protein